MTIRSVGVLGTGLMGTGIARTCAAAGFETIIVKVTPGAYDAARNKLDGSLQKEIGKGKLREEDAQRLRANLRWSNAAADLAACDLIIESIVEDLVKKQEFFEDLDEIVKPAGILASNTSTLCIAQLAAATGRAPRF